MEEIKMIRIDKLKDFKNHPFKVEHDMELFSLMESIKDEGVLVPILVRLDGNNGYEVISGHRRKEAALWSGLKEVPAIVRNLDDDQAVVAMVDSNLHRENLKPSEKAYAYKMKLEAMNRQGKRYDLTSDQVGPKLTRGNELLAKEVGESVTQIKRYVRLTNLIPQILRMVDEKRIALTIAVDISYLKEKEQYELYAVMDLEQCTPSLSQSNRMKIKSRQNALDMDEIYKILSEEKANQKEQIRIRADRLNEFFPIGFSQNQKIELIESLLRDWHEKNISNLENIIEKGGEDYGKEKKHKGTVK